MESENTNHSLTQSNVPVGSVDALNVNTPNTDVRNNALELPSMPSSVPSNYPTKMSVTSGIEESVISPTSIGIEDANRSNGVIMSDGLLGHYKKILNVGNVAPGKSIDVTRDNTRNYDMAGKGGASYVQLRKAIDVAKETVNKLSRGIVDGQFETANTSIPGTNNQQDANIPMGITARQNGISFSDVGGKNVASYMRGNTRVTIPDSIDLSDDSAVGAYIEDQNQVIDWMDNSNNEEEDL